MNSVAASRERPRVSHVPDGGALRQRKPLGPRDDLRIRSFPPSSIEALTRRVLSGRGLGNINPLVDLYNAISLQHVVPVGGWDADDLQGDALLYRTRGGEPFHELGTSKLVQAEAGEHPHEGRQHRVVRG